MAEIAAGVLATEQVLSTAAQATAAYTVAMPTNGLKASFSQIATSPADDTRASLVRSHHSLTVVGSRAFIFGGRTSSDNKLADNEIHSLALPTKDPADEASADYRLIPALPITESDGVPAARSDHSACAANGRVAIFSGVDEAGALIQDGTIWLFDVERSAWHALRAESSTIPPPARKEGKLFSQGNDFIVYGGKDESGTPFEDVWRFDYETKTWIRLPNAPAVTSNAAFSDHTLYLIAGNDDLSSSLHLLDTSRHLVNDNGSPPAAWESVVFPTNPLAPGPRPRENGGLLHVSTGYGRNYLLYFFGERSTSITSSPTAESASEDALNSKPTQWSDMWTLQLPSSDVANKSTTLSEAVKPAKIKDAIRAAFGASGEHTWAEVQLTPPGDVAGHAGKLHPGPRGFFGCDVMETGSSVVIWGGVDAKGETEGDGWIIQLE